MVTDYEDNPPNVPARDRATLLPEPERDTSPEDLSLPSVMATLSPETMRGVDSEFSEAVRLLVQTGRELAAEREARREAAEQSAQRQQTLIDQQGEIVKILTRTEATAEANHKILSHHLDELKRALAHHDDKLVTHDSQLDQITTEMGALREDMANSVAGAIQQALAPYVERIEAIEQRCQVRNDS